MSEVKITDHKVEGHWYKESPNHSGLLDKPTLIVMHFTAAGTGAADYLCRPEAQASAHLELERDGNIKQIVPFNVRAWHAGPSSWRGRTGCNAFSIGIEIANWGPCDKRADGAYYTWAGVKMPAELIREAKHKNGGPMRGWEVYPPTQLDVLESLTRALIDRYPSIVDIAGHDDVAPSIKVDPGPLFPMARFRALLGSGRDADKPRVMTRRVLASVLNVRNGPGLEHDVVSQLKAGNVVTMIEDLGDWAQVETIDGARGFVFDAYLA